LTCGKTRSAESSGVAKCRKIQHWTAELPARLALHEAGQGARLLAVAHAAGIGWTLARTWPGTRARERQLKRQGGASRRCPLCGVTPRAGANGHVPSDSRSDAAPGAAGQRRGLSHTHT
jgi:hypothetical protein